MTDRNDNLKGMRSTSINNSNSAYNPSTHSYRDDFTSHHALITTGAGSDTGIGTGTGTGIGTGIGTGTGIGIGIGARTSETHVLSGPTGFQ